MAERKLIMISSTARDLPEHRKAVEEACMRQSFFPVMMEHLPASDDDAIAESMRMVDEAEIYLGILAHRYGYVPKGHDISVTEMEYNRAGERGIPRLMFVIHEDHLVRAGDVETGAGAEKLKAFKQRVETGKVVRFFKSVDGLRGDVIDTLSRLREPNPSPFHYVSDIPAPPEAYVAHPYTLLQTGHLIGRQTELNELTEWVTKSDKPVFNVVAIGGMGKSALTWHWFNKVAPLEMKPLAGRMWWSFYESDATFENFVIRALAYVTKRPREEVQKIPVTDREEQLAGSAESRAVSGRAGWAGAHPYRLCAHGRGATFRRGGRARGRSAAQDRRSTCRRISAQGLGLPRGAPADQHPAVSGGFGGSVHRRSAA
jgi:hypothetical protein